MKVLIAKISLRRRKVQEKLDRLSKYVDSGEMEILDSTDSKIYKATIPVTLRGQGGITEMNINCQLRLNNTLRYKMLNIYADITKPLVVTLIIGLVAFFISYLVNHSIYASILIGIFGVIISTFTIFIPIRKQLRNKVRYWIEEDL